MLFFVVLILVAGDVAVNPRPMTKVQQEQTAKIESMLEALSSNMNAVMPRLCAIEGNQAELDGKLDRLLEASIAIDECLSKLESQVKNLESKIDELANRSRRSSLVFYGIADVNRKESWDESRQRVANICKEKLQTVPTTIQRAHRVGACSATRARPIIVNFMSWVEKDNILRSGFKFRGSTYGVSEDFSALVRQRRRTFTVERLKRRS